MKQPLRYHARFGFPGWATDSLKRFTKELNYLPWRKSKHFKDGLREIDEPLRKEVISFIKSLWLDYENIFEFYALDGKIIKACFRVPYSSGDKDLIIVLTDQKYLVTFYFNDNTDTHNDLSEELYEILK